MNNPSAMNPQPSIPIQSSATNKPSEPRRLGDKRREDRKRPHQSENPLFQGVPPVLLVVSGLVSAWGLFTPNPALTICSIWMLPLLAGLFLFRGEPPVLLFACAMQWLQAAAGIFYCDLNGLPVSATRQYGAADFELATWLSMAGVLVLAIGMRVALRNRNKAYMLVLPTETLSVSVAKLFRCYLLAFIIFTFIEQIAALIPQLSQPILALQTLRWVLVYLIAQTVLKTKEHYLLLFAVVVLEVATGCLGFFGGFKDVFFILLVAVLGANIRIKTRQVVSFCVLGALCLFLGIIWTVVKTEYRDALNQGSQQQEVTIPVLARIEKLSELAAAMDPAAFYEGFGNMLQRFSYVEFFAFSMNDVPSAIPYEHGKLWWGAIKHALMPRLFFPNKPVLNDSEITNKYTGLGVASAEEGTSIGIGYYGESYIDFGPIGMFLPIFLVGVFQGFIYRFFVYYCQNKTIGFSIATAILVFGAYHIEISNAKLLGSNVTELLVMVCFVKFCEKPFWSLISDEQELRPASRKTRLIQLRDSNRGGKK